MTSASENARVFAATSALITARRAASGLTTDEFGNLTAVTLGELVQGADEAHGKSMRMAMLIGQLANAAAYLLDQLALHDPARADQFTRGLAERGAGGVPCP